jgi:aspartate carbamoyltransferase catalytic subunit
VYGFCGDIGRGRTVRSLAKLLALYDDVTLIFVAPDHPKLALRPDLRDWLSAHGVRVYEADALDEPIDGVPVIEKVDALYMTRIQREHDDDQDAKGYDDIDFSKYRLSTDLVARMKEYAPILHPFPRDQFFGEIPHEIDTDPRAMYFRQARNGMWVRAALLAHIFDADHHISRYVQQNYGELHDYNDELV